MSLVEKVEAFRNVPVDVLSRLERGSVTLKPRSGTRIITEGDEATSIYAIVGGSGSVRIESADQGSKLLMVEILRQGELFGELAVLDGGPRTAEAVTDGPLHLLLISAAAFNTALAETPALGLSLCRILAQRLRRTFVLFKDATFETLEVRLARQLSYLAKLQGETHGQAFRLAGRFRQSDLADLLGTTPRSVITILNKWRAEGLVRYEAQRGQLTICDEGRLRGLIDHDATARGGADWLPGAGVPETCSMDVGK
jgi:CRP/FNR family transcriptional regulator, cyclic AMP receptor protein